jgi:ABC-type uncharacterized transport system permease subunit
MQPHTDIAYINDRSEVFLLFGLATLYAAVCPIATFYVMLHNVFDMKFDLVTQYLCLRRGLQ